MNVPYSFELNQQAKWQAVVPGVTCDKQSEHFFVLLNPDFKARDFIGEYSIFGVQPDAKFATNSGAPTPTRMPRSIAYANKSLIRISFLSRSFPEML